MADETVYECQNCPKRWKMGELINPIPDLEQRVAPGEPMPAGECPDEDCGAVCHVIDLNKPITILTVYLDGDGDLQFHGSLKEEGEFEKDLDGATAKVLHRFFIEGKIVKEDGEKEPIPVR